jgi:hypothetical protein
MYEPYTIQIEASESADGELMLACEHMVRELIGGLQHGFFEMSVTVEMMQSKKRCVTIKAGKSYRFII